MLQNISSNARQSRDSSRHRFAIIASTYNAEFVDAMVDRALQELKRAGAKAEVIRVPGAYEIPVVAAALAEQGSWNAIICLGVILRGATTHAQHIGDAVTNALTQIQLQHRLPVIHEVLLLENVQQARERCLSQEHNRGAEAALTALEMARIMSTLGAFGKSRPVRRK